MPSVRVRRRSYSTLGAPSGDGLGEEQATFPRSLANIFGSPIATQQRPAFSDSDTSGLRHSAGPHLLTTPPRGPSPVLRRPRANSRIIHHVMNKDSMRFGEGDRRSHRSSVDASGFSGSPRQGMVTLEGDQADVLVHSDGDHGIIGSALSLPHSTARSFRNLMEDEHHHDDIVEHLDVIDPEVSTVSKLTNTANAILIPPLSFYSRKPVVVLPSPDSDIGDDQEKGDKKFGDDLDRHVDNILKRPSKFRRTLRGVWAFLKTPLGIITAIYGFLVVFWGAAIVLFLTKIINLHNANTQGFWVEVSSQVENGLFTVTGIGLIPPRVLDTYRIYKIWYYKRKTRILREKAGLPQLYDIDDLPDPAYDPNYVHVLSDKEQEDLHKQQKKFQNHQTWYRAHGTETHRAFPINTALIICFLNDGNSIFQIILCGTMWGLNRFQRPPWSTGILIPGAFLCGILAGVFIWRGGQKTKRTKEVEERLRMALATAHPDDVTDDGSDDNGLTEKAPMSTKSVQEPQSEPLETIKEG